MSQAMRWRCAGPLQGVYSAEEAAALGRPAIAGHGKRGVPVKSDDVVVGYAPCDNDMTELVFGTPQDGAEHTLKCPRCGATTKVRRTPPAPADE